MLKYLSPFAKPEYIALGLSIVTIITTVYIARRNRQSDFAQAEYFKLQQIAEKIISKLLLLDNKRERLRTYFQLSYNASRDKAIFVDSNDTFNRKDFEQDGEEVVAFIDIYFPELGEEWNDCLVKMSDMFTIVFLMNENRNAGNEINWKEQAERFNTTNRALGTKPKNLADKIKNELKKFRQSNL